MTDSKSAGTTSSWWPSSSKKKNEDPEVEKNERRLAEAEAELAALTGNHNNSNNNSSSSRAQRAMKTLTPTTTIVKSSNSDDVAETAAAVGGSGTLTTSGTAPLAPIFVKYLGVPGVFMEPPKEASSELLESIRSTDNQIHSMMSLAFGTTAYMFGTLMQFSGQGTFLTSISMFGAGSYLTAMSQLRHVRGNAPEMWQGEAMAAILWWMASFRQFKEYRTLKWAGYSSWTGLLLATYYSFRALFAHLSTPVKQKFD